MMIITILTDFGMADSWVSVMKGVMCGLNPEAKFIDIAHSIPQGDIKKAAFQLFTAYKYFPKKTIHLVVVDPGVGGDRKPIIVETNDYYFVGPDNGVFSWIYGQDKFKVYKINVSHLPRFHTERGLPLISDTFHGRDIFAPVAAKLSLGIKPKELGDSLHQWVSFKLPEPVIIGDKPKVEGLTGEVIDVDRFGNLITNISRAGFESLVAQKSFEIRLKDRIINKISTSYQSTTHEPIAIFGSSNFLEISLPAGNCAHLLNLSRGSKLYIKLSPMIH